jgi:hypothetical protein
MRSLNFIWGLVCCFMAVTATAQPYFITDCTPVSTCLKPGSCTHGIISASAEATNGCLSGALNYSWQLDLFNDQSINRLGGSNFFNDSLPVGTHRIIFKATDACFLSQTCEIIATVRDCLPPVVTANNVLSAPLDVGDSCRLRMSVSQFLINFNDNCTPKSQIKFGLRRLENGTGFPADTTVIFDRCNHGTNAVEVWAKDHGGLLTKVNTLVIVQDAQNLCPCDTMTPVIPDPPIPGQQQIAGCVYWPDSSGFEFPYSIVLQKTTQLHFPGFDTKCYELKTDSAVLAQSTFTLLKGDDPLYEVNTLDILKIQRHILGLTPLPNVFALKAADVNNSGSITVADLTVLRKVILGAFPEFPDVSSFQFFNGRIYKTTGKLEYFDTISTLPSVSPFNFLALKSGNVDQFTTQINHNDALDRTSMSISYEMQKLSATQGYLLFKADAAAQAVAGWQIGVQLPEGMRVDAAGNGTNWQQLPNGSLRILSNYTQKRDFIQGEVLVSIPYTITAQEATPLIELNTDFEGMWITETQNGNLNKQSISLHLATQSSSNEIQVSPNPVGAGQTIRLLGTGGNWRILHSSGKTLARGAESQQITAPMAAGLYFLETGDAVVKFVVE